MGAPSHTNQHTLDAYWKKGLKPESSVK